MTSDYIFIRKSRNALSSFLHVLMNILLGVASIFSCVVSGSWIIGFILVLVSKWRMFAVRPRYLFLNLKSNLVDLVVGFSFVLLAYFSGTSLLPVHLLLAVGYVLWLVLIKPRTSEFWTVFQALFATFIGTSAATIACASFSSVLLVLTEFIIGYAAARHVLAQNNNRLDNGFPAFIFGLFFAELSLVLHSWLIIYAFTDFGVLVPELALVLTVFGFMCERLYSSVESRDGGFRFKEVVLPVLFTLIIISVLIISFSEPTFNI